MNKQDIEFLQSIPEWRDEFKYLSGISANCNEWWVSRPVRKRYFTKANWQDAQANKINDTNKLTPVIDSITVTNPGCHVDVSLRNPDADHLKVTMDDAYSQEALELWQDSINPKDLGVIPDCNKKCSEVFHMTGGEHRTDCDVYLIKNKVESTIYIPSVGEECEVIPHNTNWGFVKCEPMAGHIVFCDSDRFWWKGEYKGEFNCLSRFDKVDFRPIQTKEEKAIKDIADIIEMDIEKDDTKTYQAKDFFKAIKQGKITGVTWEPGQ